MRIEEEIKQTRFTSAQQKALLNLLYTASWAQAQLSRFFKPFGITGTQFNILRILKGQHPGSLSVGEIKCRLLDRHPDTPRLLNRLLAKGLIDKKTCRHDRRSTDVFITPNGLKLLEQINRHQTEMDQVLNLSDEEAVVLSNLLDKARTPAT
jgi:DNA-binding MarR family transcriptional regulator